MLLGLVLAWNGASAETLPLPGSDATWQSETFSEEVSRSLGDFGDLLKSGKPGWVASAPLLGKTMAVLGFGSPMETIRDEAGFRVRRMASGVEPGLVEDPWERLLRPFRGPLDRVKFKVIGVDLSDSERPVTRQLVTLAGPAEEGYLEQNATWRLEWSWDGEQPPVIERLIVESLEDVLAASDPGQRAFREATEAVVGGTVAYQQQLRHGNTHWRQRIELFNRFFKFGHQGLAVGDVNGDGLDDVYVCQNGGLPNRLFVQQPDGTAREVAAEAGVDLLDLTRSALLVDLDNDGDQDLVLAADSGLLAFRNDGSGRFEPEVRYPSVRNAFGMSAVDYDNDGDLDLYVCRYFANQEEGAGLAVPAPYFDANNGGGNFLIRNDGPAKATNAWLQFSDATRASGLDGENNRRFSFAAVWDDVDRDGDQDLFVANDFGLKNLYLNEDGRFRDIAVEAGIDDGGFGMSAATGDYDGDGRIDLYAGNMFSAAGSRVTQQPQFRPGLDPAILARFQHMARGNSLFRNLGPGQRFADVSVDAGVTVGRWSWGSVFTDLDNDGWEDLLVANGFVTGEVPDDL